MMSYDTQWFFRNDIGLISPYYSLVLSTLQLAFEIRRFSFIPLEFGSLFKTNILKGRYLKDIGHQRFIYVCNLASPERWTSTFQAISAIIFEQCCQVGLKQAILACFFGRWLVNFCDGLLAYFLAYYDFSVSSQNKP